MDWHQTSVIYFWCCVAELLNGSRWTLIVGFIQHPREFPPFTATEPGMLGGTFFVCYHVVAVFKLWSPETLTLGDCFTQDDGLGGCRCVRHHGAASWLNATDQGPIDWNHSAVRIYCFAWFTLFVSMYVCIYIYTHKIYMCTHTYIYIYWLIDWLNKK